ncbi:MAG TPA: ROK family protein [Candidatus Omnitrophota bacterium]|nr:ROK family protein [Candidatus Omnitrophota bacterium]
MNKLEKKIDGSSRRPVKYVVGVDVGGTNIKLGIVHPSGQVIARNYFATRPFASSKIRLINALAGAVLDIIARAGLTKKDIAGIGVGLPGLVAAGVVHFLPNIPGWRNVRLRAILARKTGLPVVVDNDVKLITLAEWKFGAGRGAANMMCITLGTGVGAGLILNNALYRGEGNAAGELGHVPLNELGPDCNCGGWGCFETYVGNRRLTARANRIMNARNMTLERMYVSAKAGNRKALRFWHETARHLGNGLIGAVNLLNPRLIVIGGGVSNNHQFLFPTIKAVIRQRAMATQAAMVNITRAQLGDDAGIIGAQVLVLANHEHA